jgi:hypothetical protein
MWTLTQRWYGDRLAESYAPKSADTLQQFLTDAGLTSSFWQLRP